MSLKTEHYFLEGKKIDFDLVRKKSVRRNILVRFEDNGRMTVSAPLRSSRQSIHLVLSDMHDQIVDLRRQVRERNRGLAPTRYRQGSRHLYMGRTYTLDVWRDANTRPMVVLRSDRIEVHVSEWGEETVRETLWRWYRKQAGNHFSQRLDHIAGSVSWLRNKHFELHLRRMKRSWGTCSTKGMITLNPLLMKAPPKYIDYVIAHELCHLREHNHSPAFYHLLEELIPNWDTLRSALNDRSHKYLRW
ncbi:MAG TPA: SprT family zinc-dependent metalloprotease [Xanthomonadales bacterium]|nr:SprT family zinc-dependent metalloprotease [Xanthomonadales bacterium]